VFCIVFFSSKTNFFFAKTRDGFEGVQRRGHVKGAGKFRVHRRPLTGSTAGITPFVKSRVEWRKNEERSNVGQEHQKETDTDPEVIVREQSSGVFLLPPSGNADYTELNRRFCGGHDGKSSRNLH
jgi:hypothetical protein